MQYSMFEDSKQAPLAFRLRPQDWEHYQGQQKIKERIERLDMDNLPHIVFSGPPGCGKTTIAHILAKSSGAQLYNFNAVLGGVKDLREIIAQAKHQISDKRPIIFIDEIHRFNKAQQDALLPYLEAGEFVLLGATTENPNTTLNKAILSRVQKWFLAPLSEADLTNILNQAVAELDQSASAEVIEYLAKHTNGDARVALNQLEAVLQNPELDFETIRKDILQENRRYDKDSERHYDVISAFIKSVRGSDVDAALLWLAVMLDGGEDIEFIARRLIILASEDIGNADPRGLQVATSAHYAVRQIGMPEARIILGQATTYLSQAPKSNASYRAIESALEYVRSNPTVDVPTHLRNHHPDKKNYKYPHAYSNHWVEQDYSGDAPKFYDSSELGYEKMQDDYQARSRNS